MDYFLEPQCIYLETNKNFTIALKSGIAFGLLMSLFELFIIPKIKKFFQKKE